MINNTSRKKQFIQLTLLFLIITTPIIYIAYYERSYLGIIDTKLNMDRGQSYQKIINNLLQTSKQTSQGQLNLLISKMNSLNQTQRQKMKQNILDKTKYNTWINTQSSFKKINIINFLIASHQMVNLQKIQKNVLRGLQWFNVQYNMNLKITKWNKQVNFDLLEVDTLLVSFQEFKYQFLQENVANRLRNGQYRNEYYINEIVKQLRSTALFSNCKFTNKQCVQKSILFLASHIKLDSYLEYEKQLYILDKIDQATIFNLFANVLELSQFQLIKDIGNISQGDIVQFYHQLKKVSYLGEASNILKYINYILKPVQNIENKMTEAYQQSVDKLQEYILNGKYLSPYIHDSQQNLLIEKFFNGLGQHQNKKQSQFLLEINPLTDTRMGKIDIFPNNFKMGIYLPLAILFGYPLILKIIDLLIFFFKLLSQKLLDKMGYKNKKSILKSC